MMLWFFGALTLSSFFILGAWAKAAWQHRSPVSIYNVPLMLAVFLDIHAFAFGMSTGIRTLDIIEGITLPTHDVLALFLSYGALLTAKVGLVWVAAVGEGKTYSKPLWWGFWATLALWTAYVI